METNGKSHGEANGEWLRGWVILMVVSVEWTGMGKKRRTYHVGFWEGTRQKIWKRNVDVYIYVCTNHGRYVRGN